MGDVILISSSIILNHFFECLQHRMKDRRNDCTEQEVDDYRTVYLLIAKLVSKVDDVFSPLILVTTGSNLVFVLNTFYCGLESSTSGSSFFITRISFHFTYVYVFLRMTVSNFLAAKLSERVRASFFKS